MHAVQRDHRDRLFLTRFTEDVMSLRSHQLLLQGFCAEGHHPAKLIYTSSAIPCSLWAQECVDTSDA